MAKCNNCNTDNREEAIYCKHCGTKMPVAQTNPFSGLVGLDEIKTAVSDIIDRYNSISQNGGAVNMECDFLIMGATGTGKTVVGNAIAKALYSAGIVKQANPTIVDAVNWDSFSDRESWQDTVNKLKDGVLIIDNAQKLVPDGESRNVDSLDILFSSMKQWNGNPVVILLGLPGGFREYIEKNPSVRHRFEYMFKLEEYTAQELTTICIKYLTEKRKTLIDDESFGKFERVFMNMVRNKPEGWGNAYEALKLADESFFNMIKNKDNSIKPEHIPGQEYHEKSADEILAELDEFVGIENIRQEIRSLMEEIKYNKERTGGKAAAKIENHYIFSGNPGTGKTTVARKMGNIFKAMGVLPIGHLVEADRSKLVAQYVGQTAQQTNDLVDKAMGGVLLIDEAYTLNQGDGDAFGHEAIDTLLKRIEDDRGKFVCIVAGYTKQMFDFIASNPGLQSRFNKEMRFEDYNGASLTEIFRMQLKQESKNMPEPFRLDDEAEKNIRNFFNHMFDMRDKNFGNARDVRKVVKTALNRQSNRLTKLRSEGKYTPDMLYVLTREDIEGDNATKVLNEEDILKELDELVGLKEVKEEVHKLTQLLKFERMRAESLGEKMSGAKDHYLFLGNPGTGKTTVARIMARIFKSLGLITKDEVIEVDRSKMVASYVGQSAPLTNQLVDRALGGCLFIDEAYTLFQGEHDSFGKEAIDTLLKRLEDDRGKFICIAAGYTREMSDFIASNSGLESRFNKTLHFEDYPPESLAEIFRRKAKSNKFNLSPEADAAMVACIQKAYDNRRRNFGNAREVNNIFSEVKKRLSDRLMTKFSQTGVPPTTEEFTSFLPEDFNI